jgi:assimilatory nitrate reductase catalytic subunit
MLNTTLHKETRSTCCYCGVGCGVIIEHDQQRILNVRGDPDHPANFGRLCTKGSTLHLTTNVEGRLLYPELREQRGSPRLRVSWDQALSHATERFTDIVTQHGPDAVAFYVSGQLLTEDYYVFNKLAKGLVGTNNIDTNSRLCMSSAVAGYKQTLGMDAPPACYEDIDHTDCLLIAGANPAYAHPILFRRIEVAKDQRPDLKIIAIDPRRTDTTALADLHLPILPGTDLVLLGSMLHVLLWEGLLDRDYIARHTTGFELARESVREMTPAAAAAVCGVPAADIVTAARWFGEAKAALSLWCQGLNQSTHGTHNTAAIVHLHLATGQIGRPGAGPFSLTGQPNAMGGREVGGMANLLSAHRDLANPIHRAEVATLWGVPEVPATPGKTAVELFDAVRTGQIKAVWIVCTNPAQSMPELRRVREALAQAEFVVLQEAFADTETSDYADLLLPATTWGEKEGTVTNSERRITHVRAAIAAPGEARADWAIARDFAKLIALRLQKPTLASGFTYACAEDVFREHAASTRGRDLDISQLSYAILDRDGPQQWPYREGGGTARLYGDGHFHTVDGKARFVAISAGLLAEKTDARYPLHLTTGRLRDQWHGMSRTGKTARLFNHASEALLDMAPRDMARRGLKDNDLVEVKSRRGKITVRVLNSADLTGGLTFLPMHFGGKHLSHPGVNELLASDFDPYSKQPELKHAAVEVSKAELPYQALILRTAVGVDDSDTAVLRWLGKVRPFLARFGYASAALRGREQPALVMRIAHAEPIPEPWLHALDRLVELPEAQCLTYGDPARNVSKRALLVDGRLAGLRLTGDVVAGDWLLETMIEQWPTAELRPWLLASRATPPAAATRRGKIVCNCFNVAETDIQTAIGEGLSLQAIQSKLQCGTSCGSCVPELKRLVQY